MKKFDEVDDWSEYKKVDKKKSKPRSDDSDHSWKKKAREYTEGDYEQQAYKSGRGK